MTSLPAVRGLVTVALLKAQFDQGKDHIGMFLPFVLDAVGHMEATNADADMIKVAIEERHGLAIPIPTLRTLLKRARRHGISRKGGRYFIQQSGLPDVGIEHRARILKEEHHALAEAFIEFARSEGTILNTTDDALALIFTFVAQNEVELLLADSPVVLARRLDKPGKSESHLTARFLMNIALKDPRLTAYIERLLEGFVLQNTLLLSDINALRTKFDKLSVYFDSGVLLGALGLLGRPSRVMYLEVIELLRKSGARLGVFDVTISELKRILDLYVARLMTSEGRRSLRPTPLTRYVLTNRLTASDLKQVRTLLNTKLRHLSVFPTDRPEHIREYTLDEKDLSKRLSVGGEFGDTINEPRVVHDVDCVAAILTLRSGRVTSDLSRSRAVFITASSKVLQTAREWYRDQDQGGVHPIIHWSTISNLAWLKRPGLGTTSKVHQLTALCRAALVPDRKTWQRFLDHLKKLEESNELDSDESVAILVSALTEQLLLDIEDDEDLDSSSLEEVVERVRESYAKIAEEEIATAKEQVRISNQRVEDMRSHHASVSDRIGRLGSWVAIVSIVVIVMLAGINWTSLTLNAITIVTFIYGVNVIGVRRKLEDMLSSWAKRLLNSPSSTLDSDVW